jgi:hypothetical protein
MRRNNMIAIALLLAPVVGTSQDEDAAGGWVALFNGRDLTGWTPKITGHPSGENFGRTFRVEDGLLFGMSRCPLCQRLNERAVAETISLDC